MRSSTLKGLALHTADEAGTTLGPDYQFGWGLLNAEKAGRVILNSNQNYVLDERTLNQAETYSLTVVASGLGPLVSTICWTDPAGTASTPSVATLNDRTPKLVNDLDIRIGDGQATTLPWILDRITHRQPPHGVIISAITLNRCCWPIRYLESRTRLPLPTKEP